MCGIVGYIGHQKAQNILLDGLSRLEYRGYDSAGLALILKGETFLRRSEGKLYKLQELVSANGLPSTSLGIAHTRWATHGRPSETNAHPHYYAPITIVHNGIIENYSQLREELKQKGHRFSSETDSEILAHLVVDALGPRTPTLTALRKALKKVRGSYALALVNQDDSENIYVARQGSSLVLGLGQNENFVASDIPALLPYTKQMIFLNDGEVAQLKADQIEITNLTGEVILREAKTISWNLSMAEKSGYKHFMLKEIFEQPQALSDTLRGRLQLGKKGVFLSELDHLFAKVKDFEALQKINLVACGTSWHAALISRYFLEPWCKIPVSVEQASEFRYREPILDAKTLVMAISQSGETADTLVAVKNAKAKGAKVLAITNVVDSTLARESDAVFYTHAGPEIGVAATKTFTTQVLALQLVGLWMAKKKRNLKVKDSEFLIQELLALPKKIESILKQVEQIKAVALNYAYEDHCLFIGRGPQFPIALEGALKLKEISYLHAEGYSAGELKHGPIALIDQGSPVVALVLQDRYYEKMISNIQEVLSRQASVIAIVTEGDSHVEEMVSDAIMIPKTHSALQPILSSVPLQLFAYFIADHKGHDVDQPRNLAKSVTVE